MKTLVFIPTYNERENVERLCDGILSLGLAIDVLFLDDNSPDGTGAVLDGLSAEHRNVHVLHRRAKLGIGSAHYEGIMWAYRNRFNTLITMDSDFTHPPERVREILCEAEKQRNASIIVGSRFMRENSLPGWNILRRTLTSVGHLMTRFLLKMKYDATGALRLYRLDAIPSYAFETIRSRGYSFFFESLYIFHKNGYAIGEFPIELPARTYGSSKMTFAEVKRSVKLLVSTYFITLFNPEKFLIVEPIDPDSLDGTKIDPQGWDQYWSTRKQTGGMLYDAVASLYRKLIIGPSLRHFVTETFPEKAELLHAGCGSGQVDLALQNRFSITGLDISVNALQYYKKTHGKNCRILHGSIFDIPLPDRSLDGVYNLGVMEHFTEPEIDRILQEFRRVVKPDGKIVLFWPPEFGLSVTFFKFLGWLCRTLLRQRDVKFHPDEITRLQSKDHLQRILERAGLKVERYYFGPRDLFTQAVVVCTDKAVEEPSGEEARRVANIL